MIPIYVTKFKVLIKGPICRRNSDKNKQKNTLLILTKRLYPRVEM